MNQPAFTTDQQRQLPPDWVPGQFPLRNAWLPVSNSRHVGKRPTWRTLHSRPVFLWREQARLMATEFHPARQGDKLKAASEFTGGSGHYPVLERYGLVWVWYGNPDDAHESLIPNVPYLPVEGGLPAYMSGHLHLNSCSELAMENLLDLTHSDFVHANLIGDEISEQDEITVETTSETITMVRTCRGKTAAPIMQKAGGIKAKTQDLRSTIHIYVRSHVALVYSRFSPGFDVPLLHCSTPESRNSCRVNFIMNTGAAKAPFRYVMPQAGYMVGAQDNSMLRPQAPRYHEPVERRDLNSRFDAATTRYRHLVQQLNARQQQGDFAYGSDANISGDKSALLRIGMPI